MNKKIVYWSPHINHVATVNAVLNSVKSLLRYSKDKFTPEIINVFGEWDNSIAKDDTVDFYNFKGLTFINKISSSGIIFSRIKYIFIFFFSLPQLLIYLKKKRPDFLIIHLMTSVPIFLNLFFNFKTKIILRISGMPKINIFRYIFWKISLRFIYKITFPTKETLENFKKLKIVSDEKLFFLSDPIIDTKINSKNIKKVDKIIINEVEFKDYYICIGRLTKQKNFQLIINSFKEIIPYKKNLKVLILGEGEEYNYLKELIKKYKLEKNIFLIGFKKNIYKYLKNSKCFILSSIWEDPGWVLIESIYSNTFVISSDCQSGPKEILSNGGGYLFKSNSTNDLIKKILMFEKTSNKEIIKMKITAKKNIIKYSLFRHFILLKKNILV